MYTIRIVLLVAIGIDVRVKQTCIKNNNCTFFDCVLVILAIERMNVLMDK